MQQKNIERIVLIKFNSLPLNLKNKTDGEDRRIIKKLLTNDGGQTEKGFLTLCTYLYNDKKLYKMFFLSVSMLIIYIIFGLSLSILYFPHNLL